MDDVLHFYIAQALQAYIAKGLPPEEAADLAVFTGTLCYNRVCDFGKNHELSS